MDWPHLPCSGGILLLRSRLSRLRELLRGCVLCCWWGGRGITTRHGHKVAEQPARGHMQPM